MEFNKICIAAGHTPSGTAGCGAIDRLDESNCTRQIAPLVVEYLKQKGINTNLQIINKGNSYTFEDCYVRAQNSNNWGSDLYVEIHLNAGRGNGCEVEVSGLGGKAEEVARRVNTSLSAALGIPNRGVNVMNLIVLNKTDCPAILVECCFVDSSDADKYNADKIAKAIAEGILNVSIQNAPKPQVAAKPQQINQNGGFDMKVYKNGSTTEDVFSDYACTNKIGSLDVKEQCSCVWKDDNRAIVLYKVDGSGNMKTGFVRYVGGVQG